jgi:hypothetical protein
MLDSKREKQLTDQWTRKEKKTIFLLNLRNVQRKEENKSPNFRLRFSTSCQFQLVKIRH